MDDRYNPFTQSSVTLTTSSSSLLSYGDDSFSLYSRINAPRRLSLSQILPSQKDIEKNILSQYQRKFYVLDQDGHCLAEELIDDMITQQSEKGQDFWEIKKLQFARSKKSQIILGNSKTVNFGRERKQVKEEIPKTARSSARLQMGKLRGVLRKKEENKVLSPSKQIAFSLVSLIKSKRQPKPEAIIDQIPPTIPTIQAPVHPNSIFLRGVEYHIVPVFIQPLFS